MTGKPAFKMFLLTCQNCDDRLGRYSCDALSESGGHLVRGSPMRPEVEDAERQLLLEMTQSVLYLERAGVNARVMNVTLPGVSQGDGSRAVWCPRCPRGSGAGRSERGAARPLVLGSDPAAPKRARAGEEAPAPLTSSGGENRAPVAAAPAAAVAGKAAGAGVDLVKVPTVHRRSSSRSEDDGPAHHVLRNRLPKWSDEIGSLTMKFLGSRVAESSSKNFLFDMPTGTGGARPVIQFGKLSSATFSLDYRFPLCPMQAFGMFLSANAWTVKQT